MKSVVPISLLIGALIAGVAGGVLGADFFNGEGAGLTELKAKVQQQESAIQALSEIPVISDAPGALPEDSRLKELESTVATLRQTLELQSDALAKTEQFEEQLDTLRRDLADAQAALAARPTAPSTTPGVLPAAGTGLDAAVERVLKARDERKRKEQLEAQVKQQRDNQTKAAERIAKALVKKLSLDAGQEQAVARVLQTRADRTADALRDYYSTLPQYNGQAANSGAPARGYNPAAMKEAARTYQQAVKDATNDAIADIRQQLSSSQQETFDKTVKAGGGLDRLGYGAAYGRPMRQGQWGANGGSGSLGGRLKSYREEGGNNSASRQGGVASPNPSVRPRTAGGR